MPSNRTALQAVRLGSSCHRSAPRTWLVAAGLCIHRRSLILLVGVSAIVFGILPLLFLCLQLVR